LVDKYNFFVVKVVAAWIDRAAKHAHAVRHISGKKFMIDGKTVSI